MDLRWQWPINSDLCTSRIPELVSLLSGANIALKLDLIYTRAYQRADASTPATKFFIGSCTQLRIAPAILMLTLSSAKDNTIPETAEIEHSVYIDKTAWRPNLKISRNASTADG